MRETAQPSIATLTRAYYALEAYVENLGELFIEFLLSELQLTVRCGGAVVTIVF